MKTYLCFDIDEELRRVAFITEISGDYRGHRHENAKAKASDTNRCKMLLNQEFSRDDYPIVQYVRLLSGLTPDSLASLSREGISLVDKPRNLAKSVIVE